MPTIDLSTFKPVAATVGDAGQIANAFSAIETFLNATLPPTLVFYASGQNISAANTDLVWPAGNAAHAVLRPNTGGGSLRSIGAPALGAGTIVSITNIGAAVFTILQANVAGSGKALFHRDGIAVTLKVGDTIIYVYDGAEWVEISRDFLSVPRTISGAFSSGPPASPDDGDIWIATGVDANGTVWQFRYNAGSGSAFKWEFIGGSAVIISGNPNAVVNTKTQVGATGYYYDPAATSYTVARAGDYEVRGQSTVDPNGGGGGTATATIFKGGAIDSWNRTYTVPAAVTAEALNSWTTNGVTAAQVIGLAVLTSNNAVYKLGPGQIFVEPKRVS